MCPAHRVVDSLNLVELEGTLVKLQRHVAWWKKKERPSHYPAAQIRKTKPSYAKLGFFTPVHASQ